MAFVCRYCRDAQWVCERHPTSPAPPHGYCDYPAKPCPSCQPPGDTKPILPDDWEVVASVDDDQEER